MMKRSEKKERPRSATDGAADRHLPEESRPELDAEERLGDLLAAPWLDALGDALIDLAASAEIRRADSPYYTDSWLIAWLERDLNSPERRSEGWPDSKIASVAERIRGRVMARKLGVDARSSGPPLGRAAVIGTIPQVLEDARAAGAAPRLDLAAAAGIGRDLWDEPCDEWVQLPEGLGAGSYVALKVAGDSMAPLLHAGDTVLVRMGPQAKVDSVILARLADGGYVIKRVRRAARSRLELASLNETYNPIVVPRTERTVVGTVVLRWCAHVGEGG